MTFSAPLESLLKRQRRRPKLPRFSPFRSRFSWMRLFITCRVSSSVPGGLTAGGTSPFIMGLSVAMTILTVMQRVTTSRLLHKQIKGLTAGDENHTEFQWQLTTFIASWILISLRGLEWNEFATLTTKSNDAHQMRGKTFHEKVDKHKVAMRLHYYFHNY